MSIQDLPDELLYQMCEGWDNLTLLSMAESYSKVYQVCSKVIEERRKEYEKRKYEDTINRIKDVSGNDYTIITPIIKENGMITVNKHLKNGAIFKLYKNKREMLYLPRLNIVSNLDNIKPYLISQGLTPEQADIEIAQSDNNWRKGG